MRASAGPTFCDFAWRSRQRGARQHGVLARNPSLAAVAKKRRHSFFDRSCTDHARIAQFDEHRAFSRIDVVGNDAYRAHLVRSAIIGAIVHRQILSAKTCKQSAFTWRKTE